MTKKLPRKLGGEFWFSLSIIPFALFFAYLAVLQGSGRNLLGSLLVAAIFARRLYDRVQQVRLGRFLRANPEMQRIYQSWHQD